MAQVSLCRPTDYGVPEKFREWRPGQEEIFMDMLTSSRRFDISAVPTGGGKSPIYVAAALALGGRTAILTQSKALQDQIYNDFRSCLFDMRGLGNYTCHALEEGGELEQLWTRKHRRFRGKPTCDIGPCRSGMKCGLKDNGCSYFDAWRASHTADIVSTNYAYWIAINRYGQGLGDFDRLILDECQHADGAVLAAMSAEFTAKELREMGSHPAATDNILTWRMWARVQKERITRKLDFFAESARIGANDDGVLTFAQDTDVPDASELFMWKSLETRCTTIAESGNDWVVEAVDGKAGHVRLAPPWVGKYTEELLFRNIPKVIMVSATVRPKTADLLGVPPSDREFREYSSPFPKENRPIFWLPTIRMNASSDTAALKRWVLRIDQILERHLRLGHKGVVHTVSYKRQQFLAEHSRFSGEFLTNTPGTTRDTVRDFKKAESGVLVSPSVSTGYDFPDDECRFQIIGKLPFRDARGAVEKAQLKKDKDYLNYLTAQELIQTYGRGFRSDFDAQVVWIVDDNIEWFMRRYRTFFTDYFLEAFFTANGSLNKVQYVQDAVFPEFPGPPFDMPEGKR